MISDTDNFSDISLDRDGASETSTAAEAASYYSPLAELDSMGNLQSVPSAPTLDLNQDQQQHVDGNLNPITAALAQLPNAASTVFSTFSNIIKGSPSQARMEDQAQATSVAEPPQEPVNPYSYMYSSNVDPTAPPPKFFSPTDDSLFMKQSVDQATNNTFRLGGNKKKTYAHIPGLSQNQMANAAQAFNPNPVVMPPMPPQPAVEPANFYQEYQAPPVMNVYENNQPREPEKTNKFSFTSLLPSQLLEKIPSTKNLFGSSDTSSYDQQPAYDKNQSFSVMTSAYEQPSANFFNPTPVTPVNQVEQTVHQSPPPAVNFFTPQQFNTSPFAQPKVDVSPEKIQTEIAKPAMLPSPPQIQSFTPVSFNANPFTSAAVLQASEPPKIDTVSADTNCPPPMFFNPNASSEIFKAGQVDDKRKNPYSSARISRGIGMYKTRATMDTGNTQQVVMPPLPVAQPAAEAQPFSMPQFQQFEQPKAPSRPPSIPPLPASYNQNNQTPFATPVGLFQPEVNQLPSSPSPVTMFQPTVEAKQQPLVHPQSLPANQEAVFQPMSNLNQTQPPSINPVKMFQPPSEVNQPIKPPAAMFKPALEVNQPSQFANQEAVVTQTSNVTNQQPPSSQPQSFNQVFQAPSDVNRPSKPPSVDPIQMFQSQMQPQPSTHAPIAVASFFDAPPKTYAAASYSSPKPTATQTVTKSDLNVSENSPAVNFFQSPMVAQFGNLQNLSTSTPETSSSINFFQPVPSAPEITLDSSSSSSSNFFVNEQQVVPQIKEDTATFDSPMANSTVQAANNDNGNDISDKLDSLSMSENIGSTLSLFATSELDATLTQKSTATPFESLIPKYLDTQVHAVRSTPSPAAQSKSYRPVYRHWFYQALYWHPFAMSDSLALDDAVANEKETVLTDGARFEVNLTERRRTSIYWLSGSNAIRRCSWFFKNPNGSETNLIPFDEATADFLEAEYEKAVLHGSWNHRLHLPNAAEEFCVITSATSIEYHQIGQVLVVKRGVDEFVIDDGEEMAIDHLIISVSNFGDKIDDSGKKTSRNFFSDEL